jgi:hypothetical protein
LLGIESGFSRQLLLQAALPPTHYFQSNWFAAFCGALLLLRLTALLAVLFLAVLQGGAAAAAGPLEDLDGFVHMNMIDDLLSGSE